MVRERLPDTDRLLDHRARIHGRRTISLPATHRLYIRARELTHQARNLHPTRASPPFALAASPSTTC
jgi:hypothetical protein